MRTWLMLAGLALVSMLSRAEPLPNCVQCHGTGVAGNVTLAAPNLSILPKWYVLHQLRAYDQRWRDHTPESQDMQAVVQGMSKADISIILTFLGKLPVKPARPTINGDIAHGKTLYHSDCVNCHGETASGDPKGPAPPLAGQNDWYLLSQLKAFMHGTRGTAEGDKHGQSMRQHVAILHTKQDALDVVSYINSVNKL